MLKISIICLLIALTFAKSPSWLGEWYVLNQSIFGVYPDGEIPQNGTIAVMTVSSTAGAGLQLDGLGPNDQNMTWYMNWRDNDTTPHVCTQYGCVFGNMTTERGITYANISWHYLDGVNSIVMTPVQLSWVGAWYVVQSSTQDGDFCIPPKMFTYATIAEEDGELTLVGNDGNPSPVTWDLNWKPNDLFVNYTCSEDSDECQGGYISMSGWYLYANIQWNIEETNCSATMVRVIIPSEEKIESSDFDEQVPVKVEIKENPVPFIADEPWINYGSLKGIADADLFLDSSDGCPKGQSLCNSQCCPNDNCVWNPSCGPVCE